MKNSPKVLTKREAEAIRVRDEYGATVALACRNSTRYPHAKRVFAERLALILRAPGRSYIDVEEGQTTPARISRPLNFSPCGSQMAALSGE